MAFTLKFDTDNDAFADDPSIEAARILDNVAAAVEQGRTEGKVLDYNGNTVGKWSLK